MYDVISGIGSKIGTLTHITPIWPVVVKFVAEWGKRMDKSVPTSIHQSD